MTHLAELAADEDVVVAELILVRLLVPLLIPRFPLFIVAALALDAADNSLLERFTDVDLGPDGPYQSFDKALDIYYLVIAYLAAMRNWTSDSAFRIAQFLLYYRLVGSILFELTNDRAVLLVFPNTFEYFFIAYEVVRLRYRPERCTARFWLLVAAVLWVVVKLPQEYWIHIAQRDFTDTVADNPLVGVACALVVLALAAFALLWVRPRLPAPDWDWRVAAAPLPGRIAETHKSLWGGLAEKTTLLAFLAVIFASMLPRVTTTALETAVAAVVIVFANTGISTWFVRHGGGATESAVRFGALLAVNLLFVWVASLFVGQRDNFPFTEGFIFAFLFTLIVSLYDVYKPAYHARFSGSPLRVTSLRDFAGRVAEPAP